LVGVILEEFLAALEFEHAEMEGLTEQ